MGIRIRQMQILILKTVKKGEQWDTSRQTELKKEILGHTMRSPGQSKSFSCKRKNERIFSNIMIKEAKNGWLSVPVQLLFMLLHLLSALLFQLMQRRLKQKTFLSKDWTCASANLGMFISHDILYSGVEGKIFTELNISIMCKRVSAIMDRSYAPLHSRQATEKIR